MGKWVDLLTADRKRENYRWVKAYFKNYPVSKSIIVFWDNKYRSAMKSHDGKGFVVAIPSTLGFPRYEFLPVLGVRDPNARRYIKFRKTNYIYTGKYGPEIPANLRKALAEEHLLIKILDHEGFDTYHIYRSGWSYGNPNRWVDEDKREIHTTSRFDIEIHDNGQARKLIDVVGVEPNFRKKPAYRISSFDPKLFDDKRKAKIYIAWSTNYSLSIFAIVQTIKIWNRTPFDTKYREGLLKEMWLKKVGYFPEEIIDLIGDALHNKKITHQIKTKYGETRYFADLFEFSEDLYKKDMADFRLINLRANRRLFDKTHIPLKEIAPRAISPDELDVKIA